MPESGLPRMGGDERSSALENLLDSAMDVVFPLRDCFAVQSLRGECVRLLPEHGTEVTGANGANRWRSYRSPRRVRICVDARCAAAGRRPVAC